MWPRARLGLSPDDLFAGARLVRDLPRHLRRPLAVEDARAVLRHRLEQREADFVALLRRIFRSGPADPYRQLLRLAGCEKEDLAALVRRDGIEQTLRVLYRHGVYLTADEFKGRRPVVRGGRPVAMDAGLLGNPRSTPHLTIQSSGSRGARTSVPLDLRFIRDCAVDLCLAMNARGGVAWRKGHWHVPGGAVIARLLEYATFGPVPERWFSQIDVAAGPLPPRYRWSARMLRLGGWLGGRRLPVPRYVPLADPLPVAAWMHDVLQSGATPHILTFTSSAAALCGAAFAAGLDLTGAQFTVGGEPITEARLAAVRRVGAKAVPIYGTAEAGAIGHGCLHPAAPDEVHQLHDFHGVIQAGPDGRARGMPPDALLLTSLRPTTPLVLVNVALGDQAVLGPRACGCPLEALGWTTHLQSVRGYDKLTAVGMTFLDTDLIRVLEEALPARFGGGPTDYQVVEEEDDDGRSRLRLLVHPGVGPVAPAAVVDGFLAALGAGPGAQQVMALQWRAAGFVVVERAVPVALPSGKVLHVHRRQRG
jgi:hypothetical protein